MYSNQSTWKYVKIKKNVCFIYALTRESDKERERVIVEVGACGETATSEPWVWARVGKRGGGNSQVVVFYLFILGRLEIRVVLHGVLWQLLNFIPVQCGTLCKKSLISFYLIKVYRSDSPSCKKRPKRSAKRPISACSAGRRAGSVVSSRRSTSCSSRRSASRLVTSWNSLESEGLRWWPRTCKKERKKEC